MTFNNFSEVHGLGFNFCLYGVLTQFNRFCWFVHKSKQKLATV